VIPHYLHEWLAGIIFVGAYAAIASDKFDKTKVALLGAALMLLLGIVSQEQAFGGLEGVVEGVEQVVEAPRTPDTADPDHVAPAVEERESAFETLLRSGLRSLPGVDWNTVFLLIGMMMVVGITKRTGVFQWVAIKSAKLSGGDPLRIMLLLSVVTAVLSAGLDNVTTVLLIAPVTLVIADALDINPVPILICQIMASNIGGTATLVGDPPNIIIGSQAGLTFNQFLFNLTPVIFVVMIVYLFTVRLIFRNQLTASEEAKQRILAFDESKAITDPRLLRKCLVILGLIFVGFALHNRMGWEPATVALSGAAVLFFFSGLDTGEILEEVEWPTIFFFIGLFIMVGALVKVGIIHDLSKLILNLFGDNIFLLAMAVMWFSAVASAVVDNIPYVAAMCPLVINLAEQLGLGVHSPQMMPIWWSLALGACLGGNGTLVGASANVVVAGISRRAGHPIGFIQYLKYGAPLMVQTLIISAVYVWFMYLRKL